MCQKCGSKQNIGPKYGRGPYGGEWLQYECSKCGYAYRTATKDETARADARIAWAQQMRREDQPNKSLS